MTDNLQKRFEAHARSFFPEFFSGERMLLAFSGGVDSTVLGDLLAGSGVPFAAAHCNFRLRGKESERDERFARSQAGSWGVELYVKAFDTREYAGQNKLSIEMAARELRYGWFGELIEEYGYAGLATAHHGDDQVETVLLNLARGTSLGGLVGMRPRNGKILRPLLPFSREEIERYAREKGLEWAEDSSNASGDYTRNRIRREVMPVLKGINPSLVRSVGKNTEYLRGVESLYGRLVREKADGMVFAYGQGEKISIVGLKSLGGDAGAMLYEVLKRYGLEDRAEDVMECVFWGQSGAEFRSEGYRLMRDRDFLLVEPVGAASERIEEEIFEIPAGVEWIRRPVGFRLCVSDVCGGEEFAADTDTAYFDADKLAFPLVLRGVREGDVFLPFGMGGRKKKVSKLLKDEKIPVMEKERVWLLCSGDGRVAWVTGIRASEEFRVTEATRRVLAVRLER